MFAKLIPAWVHAMKRPLAAIVLLLFAGAVYGQGVVLTPNSGNQANAPYSGVGGVGNTNNAFGALVWGVNNFSDGGCAFGRNHTVHNNDSCAFGAHLHISGDNGFGWGWDNIGTGNQSTVWGYGSNDRDTRGVNAFAMGDWAGSNSTVQGSGKAQRREFLSRCISVGAVACKFSTEPDLGARYDTVINLPPNSTFRVTGSVVAHAPGVSCSWELKALVRLGASASTVTVPWAVITPEYCNAGLQFSVAPDPTLGALQLVGTGASGLTVQWLANVMTLENVDSGASPPPPPPPPPTLTVATASLPLATAGVAYSAPLSATGGVPPYTWSASGLPTGLSVSGASIVGTPPTAAVVTVVLTVMDAGGATATKSLLLTVGGVPPPPPPTGSNVALASAGAVATASSTYSDYYPAFTVNDGDRIGRSWGQGGIGSGWADGTVGIYPDWVQINFSGTKTINRVVVYTLQDSSSPVEPTDSMTFTKKGVIDFTVQGWNGAAWVVLGTVTGNNLVKRTVTFAAYTTNKIRVNVTAATPNGSFSSYSRIVEIEAWGAN